MTISCLVTLTLSLLTYSLFMYGHCDSVPSWLCWNFWVICASASHLQSFLALYLYLVSVCPFSCTPLSVSVKPLAVKTASEMTYVMSGGVLNCTHSFSLHPSVNRELPVHVICWIGVKFCSRCFLVFMIFDRGMLMFHSIYCISVRFFSFLYILWCACLFVRFQCWFIFVDFLFRSHAVD